MLALLRRYRSWAAGHPWSLPFAWFVVLTVALRLLVPELEFGGAASFSGFLLAFYVGIRTTIRHSRVPLARREGESAAAWSRRKRQTWLSFNHFSAPFARVRASAPAPAPGGRPYRIEGEYLNLSYEREIVWLVDPSNFRYVLEQRQFTLPYGENHPASSLKVVALAELRSDLPRDAPFIRERRIWTVEPDHPREPVPANAVDPSSLRPGRYSHVAR